MNAQRTSTNTHQAFHIFHQPQHPQPGCLPHDPTTIVQGQAPCATTATHQTTSVVTEMQTIIIGVVTGTALRTVARDIATMITADALTAPDLTTTTTDAIGPTRNIVTGIVTVTETGITPAPATLDTIATGSIVANDPQSDGRLPRDVAYARQRNDPRS